MTTRVIAFGGMYIHVHVCTKVYACIHMRLQLRNSPTIEMSLSKALYYNLIILYLLCVAFMCIGESDVFCGYQVTVYILYSICFKGAVLLSNCYLISDTLHVLNCATFVQILGMGSMMTVDKCFLMNNQP